MSHWKLPVNSCDERKPSLDQRYRPPVPILILIHQSYGLRFRRVCMWTDVKWGHKLLLIVEGLHKHKRDRQRPGESSGNISC